MNDTLSRGVAESFSCIVEIPKGSRNKYEFDHEHARLVVLHESVVRGRDQLRGGPVDGVAALLAVDGEERGGAAALESHGVHGAHFLRLFT